jgi:ubiquinone/menaquinone biosynthesis C-methylase UbiE
LPNPEHASPADRWLAGKPTVLTHPVEACLGNPAAGSTVIASGYDFEYATCANQFEIRRANDCALLYVFPQPAPESLPVIYPKDYIPFQFNELGGIVRWARDFIQRGKARALGALAGDTGKILDVGTGSGMLLRLLARVRGSRENLWANDFSEEIAAPLAKEGFQTLVGPAESLETSERFRVITLNQVIEHLQNPVRVVERLELLLENGGYLFIETPSTDGKDSRIFRRRYWGGYHIPRHFFIFNEASLRQLLEGAGLQVVEVRYMCSPAFWIQSFHHALLDKGWTRLSKFFTVKNPILLAIFTTMDTLTIWFGGKTSNIRIVGKEVAR